MGDNSRFYVPVLTILTLAAVVLLVRFWPNLAGGWQSYLCESNRCTLMDWFSALSGWVGFGAAAIGTYFVLQQLKEQRRQTGFMLGEADPTCELRSPALNGKPPRFRIVNWNRNLIVINVVQARIGEIDIYPEKLVFRVQDAFAQKTVERKLIQGKLEVGFPIDGWIDRQGPPRVCDIGVVFDLSSLPNVDLSGDQKILVTLLGINPNIDQRIYRFERQYPVKLVIGA